MIIYCALCWAVALDIQTEVQHAVTIVDGNASCAQHLEVLLSTNDLTAAVHLWKEQNQ